MERNNNAYYDLVAATVEAFNERIQADKLTQDDDGYDALHEVVDNNVPHYYHEIFTVMAADGIDHAFEDSGLMPDTNDVTVILQARIYEALWNDVLNDCGLVWYEKEDEEDEEDEA
ncbi:ocr-like anti-restriction [Pectobacterium phage PP74]|uniref:Ocr protein n=1 Tax=Pectobacterium phage PP74 TaxID=1916101 RepID=A0A1J0MF91_9CAUD|nr:ocr-like anti-restriction [Pectobacterium phage PP74]APD19618.1 ocr protein [Pectobacterium phage PP74]